MTTTTTMEETSQMIGHYRHVPVYYLDRINDFNLHMLAYRITSKTTTNMYRNPMSEFKRFALKENTALVIHLILFHIIKLYNMVLFDIFHHNGLLTVSHHNDLDIDLSQ